MEQTGQLVVIAANGMESSFAGTARVNFNRDHLLLTIQTDSAFWGWHWDQFVCMIRSGAPDTAPKTLRSVEVAVALAKGMEKRVEILTTENPQWNFSNNTVTINGQDGSVIINLDFFTWFRVLDK